LSLGILKSPVKGKGGPDWHRHPVRHIPGTRKENYAKIIKKNLISGLFFVINSGNWRQFRIPIPAGKHTAVHGKR
jgi:hypothetical protein